MDPGEISAAMDAAPDTTTGVPGDVGQAVFGALDALESGQVTPGSVSSSTLSQLNNLGMGNITGFNPNNPTQTVGQMVASQNLQSALNFAAPGLMSVVPGFTTAVTLQSLLSGKGFVNPLDVFTAAVNAPQGQGGTTGMSGFAEGGGAQPEPVTAPALAGLSPDLFASGGASGGESIPFGRPSVEGGTWSSGAGVAGASGMFGTDDEEERRRRGELPQFEEGGMIGPGGMPMVGGAPMAGVQQPMQDAEPQMAAQQVQQFVQQNPQQVQEIQGELLDAMQSGELQPQALNRVVQLTQVVMQNPEMYPYVRNFLIQQGIMDDDDLPPQYSPGVLFLLGLIAEAAKTMSGSMGSMAGVAPPVESLARGGNVPDSAKRSGGVIIEAHEGEYVIPAHIVRQKGTDFFDKLIGKDVKAEKGTT